MMRHMFDRLALLAAATATATLGFAPPLHADPPCPVGGCPHGPANSPSYKDGYKTEHHYFSIPQNRAYLQSEMKNGYTVGLACQVEVGGGPPPANLNDRITGCMDALHDLRFKP